MDRVAGLAPNSGFFDLTAGIDGNGSSWAAFAQTDLGLHEGPVDLFSFAKGEFDAQGPAAWSAGVGLKGHF